tara:strand:+ start:1948 stop:2373 length:426 start_codon:yes stop_codon:yes gene_type:complete
MKKFILLLIIPFLSFAQAEKSFLPVCSIDMNKELSGEDFTISSQELKSSIGLIASKHPQSIEDANFKIIEYSVSYIDRFGHEKIIAGIKDNKFDDPRIESLFHSLKTGEKILFYDIEAQKFINGKVQPDLISLKNITITIK